MTDEREQAAFWVGVARENRRINEVLDIAMEAIPDDALRDFPGVRKLISTTRHAIKRRELPGESDAVVDAAEAMLREGSP